MKLEDVKKTIREIPDYPIKGILFYDLTTALKDSDALRAISAEVRKPGKLPADTISKSYAKEYGTDTIEIHRDAITEDDIVVIHDDLLATGGTMAAAYELVKSMNPKKIYVSFIVELSALNGRKAFDNDVEVDTLLKY